jgi:hypothetical protein
VIYRYGVKGQVWSVEVDRTDPDQQSLPVFSGKPIFSGNMSPDGLRIVDERTEPGVLDGEPGVWRQLYLTNVDGSDPRVLFSRFVKDSDVKTHVKTHVPEADQDDPRWPDDVREWVGPKTVRWSPKGDRVAFLAAVPFDPDSEEHYYFQVEVWVYELATDILAKLTDNADGENGLSWRGPGTSGAYRTGTAGQVEPGGTGSPGTGRDEDLPSPR